MGRRGGGGGPGPPARLSRSESVFAREMERKLGLDGGSKPRRIEIKAARKIYATRNLSRNEGGTRALYPHSRLGSVYPVNFFFLHVGTRGETPPFAIRRFVRNRDLCPPYLEKLSWGPRRSLA